MSPSFAATLTTRTLRRRDAQPATSPNAPTQITMIEDVLAALRSTPPRLPTKYLYDAKGSALFEKITRLPEYYPTRTEMAIFDEHLPAMTKAIGPDAWLVELGSGSGRKTQQLLQAMDRPAGYTPIEISASALRESVKNLSQKLPDLKIIPYQADFTSDLDLPETAGQKRVCFFPGSTLGNFNEAQSRELLARIGRWVQPGGGLLIGVDLVKSPDILIPAYDDNAGVTAAFNLNLLVRLNREAAANFNLAAWAHRAVWNQTVQRMESYLVSTQDQDVRIHDQQFRFTKGQAVWTEQSQKYTLAHLCDLATGYELRAHWQDSQRWCAVVYLEYTGAVSSLQR